MAKMIKIPKDKEVPFAGITPAPTTEQEMMITGNWRFMRPVIDKARCTKCRICWVYCPDACIVEGKDGFSVNLKYCKGCGICTKECPVGAITEVPELDFPDGVVRLEKLF